MQNQAPGYFLSQSLYSLYWKLVSFCDTLIEGPMRVGLNAVAATYVRIELGESDAVCLAVKGDLHSVK
eukprot:COSAG02_NODE_947_length_15716_cov_7.567971_5_plen_68_part_00